MRIDYLRLQLLNCFPTPRNNGVAMPHAVRGTAQRLPTPRSTIGILLAVVAIGGCSQSLPRTPAERADRERQLRDAARPARSAALDVTWSDDGAYFEYDHAGKHWRYAVAEGAPTIISKRTLGRDAGRRGRGRGSARPERGRQESEVESPDGKWEARYRRRNIVLKSLEDSAATAPASAKAAPSSSAASAATSAPIDGAADSPGDDRKITTDGSVSRRIKNGSASWVYGEELDQTTAMWWSPDSQKLAYYRFDESEVNDYYIAMKQVAFQSELDTEAFPKPGTPNPVVDVYIYDVNSGQTVRVDVRDGKPFDDDAIGHYVYGIEWTKDSGELLMHRTNRRQNIMELVAVNPTSGKCRVIVREEWPTGWVENSPEMKFLKDGRRFILASDRSGYRNYYLYELSGRLIATLTHNQFDAGGIVRIDESRGLLYYKARSGNTPLTMQLHRVDIPTTTRTTSANSDTRLTDPAWHHTIELSPTGDYFVDVRELHDVPPSTWVVHCPTGLARPAPGPASADLALAIPRPLVSLDRKARKPLGIGRVELFTFKAADGVTDLYGLLHKPRGFTPLKKYPLLVSVYAGPATSGARESFATPSALTEHGFLVASIDSRSADGRGRRQLDSIYQKLGIVEIDDQAAGVRHLLKRGFVDKNRVGIHGVSYGGYASIMCLLRYPDVFTAACASSSVTDWRGYDTIYTERYMWLPDGSANRAGYDAGAAMTYAKNLRGRLMLYYGTADNNVHPAHSMQLIAELQKHHKSFEVQVGPDAGHSGLSTPRMLEFFLDAFNHKRGADVSKS